MPVRDLTQSETDQLLTQEQVDVLPPGKVVAVKWSGGNGPHLYVIWHNKSGMTIAGQNTPGSGPHGSIVRAGENRFNDRVFDIMAAYEKQRAEIDQLRLELAHARKHPRDDAAPNAG